MDSPYLDQRDVKQPGFESSGLPVSQNNLAYRPIQ